MFAPAPALVAKKLLERVTRREVPPRHARSLKPGVPFFYCSSSLIAQAPRASPDSPQAIAASKAPMARSRAITRWRGLSTWYSVP